MTWWNRKSKPDDPEVLIGQPGEAIPCNNPQTGVVTPTPDPEPDLSTKPKDVVGYCFGYVCSKKHVGKTFDLITTDGYKGREVCQACGNIAKPAIVRKIAEAQWGNKTYQLPYYWNPKSEWGWYNNHSYIGKTIRSVGDRDTIWTKHEFVHYLNTSKRRKR